MKLIWHLVALLFLCNFTHAQQISTAFTNPTSCDCDESSDGTITIHGLTRSTTYQVSYTLNRTPMPASSIASDANGVLVISNLSSGAYTNFLLTSHGIADVPIAGPITLVDPKIAKQVTKFFGAGYANFTGIQDDDPTGYAQFYARLSQPLNNFRGLNCTADWWERFIWVRNTYLQLTYGNTDTYKMYTYDTLKDKYVNRLDLLAHSYYYATLGINIITYVLPKWWGGTPCGDMAHIYLDFIVSLAATNVTDTLGASNASTNKVYNVKSNVLGWNLKASFSDAFKTNFNIDMGYQMLFILPSSGTINPNESPQNTDVPSINYAQNANRNFLTSGARPYNRFDVWVSYNTGNGTPGNQTKTTSNSNVFLKYTFVTNFGGIYSKHYPNNYFQFQIGYVLDISKLFYPQANKNPS